MFESVSFLHCIQIFLSTGKNHELQKSKANKDVPNATTVSNPQNPGSAVPVIVDASTDAIMDDASKNILDGRSTPRYNAMIF